MNASRKAETPLYVSAQTKGMRQGERILHRDVGCASLISFDEPTVATTAQRNEGRLCLLCGYDDRPTRRGRPRRRVEKIEPLTLEEWRARQEGGS